MHTLVVLLASAVWLDGSLAAQQPRIPAQSIADLEAAARRDSNDAFVHYRLAMAYRDQKRWDEAEHSLHQALAVAPNYADAHLALGVTGREQPIPVSLASLHVERAYSFFSTIAQSGGEANRPRFASWFLWYEALAAVHARDYSRAEADLRLLLARPDSLSTFGGESWRTAAGTRQWPTAWPDCFPKPWHSGCSGTTRGPNGRAAWGTAHGTGTRSPPYHCPARHNGGAPDR
jgi:hypothetical protein